MQKLRPFLWFDTQAGDAAKFYTSIFKNATLERVSYEGPGETGAVRSATFELEGQQFIAFNGGPHFTFSPAISFFVSCETQTEIDHFWERLSEGGEKNRCGWLTDKFGVTWQIVPSILGDLLDDEDDAKSSAVMEAMLGMNKLDIAGLKKAYEQASAGAPAG
jgi:predicted 3-demethylubiquinone-9 3-methyltransferase (glyoxalase superfamily)